MNGGRVLYRLVLEGLGTKLGCGNIAIAAFERNELPWNMARVGFRVYDHVYIDKWFQWFIGRCHQHVASGSVLLLLLAC